MRWATASVLIAVLSTTLFAQELDHHDHAAAASYGNVNFVTSCSPAVKDDFNRVVAMLHSFEYDTARAAFLKIAEKQPSCAIAHWGAAMTYFHGAWGEADPENGAKEAAKARELAASNPTTTAREKAYIEAVSAIYSEPNASVHERARKFAAAMEKVYQTYPDDDEAAIFYAVALYDGAGSDQSYANQRRCGEILEPLFKKLPNHPGIAHYLIHCYDNPVLARQGLSAAREYAKIAPDSAHATHMPSHIFVRLGLWQDVIDSNLQSIKVAQRGAPPCHERGSELHVMHFLQFAYLQLGRQKNARSDAEQASALPTDHGCESGAYIAGSYALDAHDWEMVNQLDLQRFANQADPPDILLTAIGVAAARTGNLARAQQAEDALAKVKDESAQKVGSVAGMNASSLELAAWIAQAQHDSAKALDLMRQAEQAGGLPAWAQPLPVEQLGDLLMEQHKPEQALEAYRKALENTANLFNDLYGAARAAKAAHQTDVAAAYYRKLLEIAGTGDREEIAASREELETLKASGAE
ncbi:MAG TPA: hypothetical protein VE866_12870 [Candidatus Binatia bacterium]|nr:hypothetical protein [Candidatus Binatia bacterium]